MKVYEADSLGYPTNLRLEDNPYDIRNFATPSDNTKQFLKGGDSVSYASSSEVGIFSLCYLYFTHQNICQLKILILFPIPRIRILVSKFLISGIRKKNLVIKESCHVSETIFRMTKHLCHV